MYIPLIFTLFLLANFIVAFLAPHFIPYLGHFASPDVLNWYVLPSWTTHFANFDGIHYIKIARIGYEQYNQAFFPFYPVIIHLLAPALSNNLLTTGLLISLVSFYSGLFVFKSLLESYGLKGNNIIWTLLFLIAFPTSFFFGAVYTESLFFLFTVLCLLRLQQKDFLSAGILAYFAAITRVVGIFLIVPIVWCLWQEHKKVGKTWFVLLLPTAGLATYMFYLSQTVHDPLAFFHAQSQAFERSSGIILLPQVIFRYLKILTLTPFSFAYSIALLELGTFLIWFTIICWQLYKNTQKNTPLMPLILFSFCNLILPTLTGTFLSIPRFALLSLSAFVFLGQMNSKVLKAAILLFFITVHVILLMYFIQGYFVS